MYGVVTNKLFKIKYIYSQFLNMYSKKILLIFMSILIQPQAFDCASYTDGSIWGRNSASWLVSAEQMFENITLFLL